MFSKEESLEILAPYSDDLYEIVFSAWRNYPRLYKDVLNVHTPRSKSSLIHDHMVHHARQAFEGNSKVRCFDTQRLFLLNFHGKLLVRFKKLYEDKMPRNIPTQQTVLFSEQLELPQIPSATHLVVGYELDAEQLGLQSISITCPNGKQTSWYSEIDASITSDVIGFEHIDTEEENEKLATVKNPQEVKESDASDC